MDAVVIVDPLQYQRRHDEPDDLPAPLRTLHFGQHDEGLVTFLGDWPRAREICGSHRAPGIALVSRS
jgi:hypothetical protein